MLRSSLTRLLITLVILVTISSAMFYQYRDFMNTPLQLNEDSVLYRVYPGMNIKTLSEDLTQKGYMSHPAWMFQLYARVTSQAHLIKAGEYKVQSGTTLPLLLEQFVGGKVMLNAFTIIEGQTVKQLLVSLADNTSLTHTLTENAVEQLVALTASAESHPEGLFLPETYHFPTGTSDIEFLKRAYSDMQSQLNAAWESRDKDLPYKNPYEALIMASIIEKETAVADERPDIAGVFVRRLKRGMRLQTDPTVIYGLGDKFDGNLRRKDLRTDTPYNTYTRHGLPPTPICLPSIESIEAALHPAEGDSIFFVATGENGRHVFSSNLKDHNNAVRRYQLKK